MKNRIGILTYHQVINDGAILQALAQQNAYARAIPGAVVEIVDFNYEVIEKREWIGAIKDLIKFDKAGFSKFRKYLRTKKFVRNKLKLSPKRFVSNDYKDCVEYLNANYDVLIVGSDEVWKIDFNKYARPFPNVYWLPDGIETIRIASAASANTLKIGQLTDAHKDTIASLLNKFQLIGVRDQFTYNLVTSYSGNRNLQLMPDPTFGLEFDPVVYNNVQLKLTKAGVDLSKPVIALSLSSHIAELKNLSELAFNYFNSLGYQVVCVGQYNKFCNINLAALFDPIEWAHSYKFFTFCITDRFHSTIFSIRNNVDFFAVDFSKRYEEGATGKIFDLMSRNELLYRYANLGKTDLTEVMETLKALFQNRLNATDPKLLEVNNRLCQQFNSFVDDVKSIIVKS